MKTRFLLMGIFAISMLVVAGCGKSKQEDAPKGKPLTEDIKPERVDSLQKNNAIKAPIKSSSNDIDNEKKIAEVKGYAEKSLTTLFADPKITLSPNLQKHNASFELLGKDYLEIKKLIAAKDWLGIIQRAEYFSGQKPTWDTLTCANIDTAVEGFAKRNFVTIFLKVKITPEELKSSNLASGASRICYASPSQEASQLLGGPDGWTVSGDNDGFMRNCKVEEKDIMIAANLYDDIYCFSDAKSKINEVIGAMASKQESEHELGRLSDDDYKKACQELENKRIMLLHAIVEKF